jgi:predicted secreted Zn-dependent protease
MMKGISIFLLLVAVATTSFAEEGKAGQAAVDQNAPIQSKSGIIPPVVTEKYEYYEVCGICEKDLQCDLKQKCITLNDGKKYDSITSWKVKWDYGYNNVASTCKADSFTVNLEVIFRLPKWVRTDEAPKDLVDKWDTFMRNLLTHEKGHRDLAIAAAAELVRAVAELPPAPTCAELDKNVQDMSHMSMKRLNEEQNQYDVTTNHGQTQGAVFP